MYYTYKAVNRDKPKDFFFFWSSSKTRKGARKDLKIRLRKIKRDHRKYRILKTKGGPK
jgi:hypothetical protein